MLMRTVVIVFIFVIALGCEQNAFAQTQLTINGLESRSPVAFARSSASASVIDTHDIFTEPKIASRGFDVFNKIERKRSESVTGIPTSTANTSFTSSLMPEPLLSFDGLSNYQNVAEYGLLFIPPDMNGDVGPNHYVQIANSLIAVYDKSGNALAQPFRINRLFSPLNTVCSARNDGLPVVLYDALADRWLISQVCSAFPPFRQMVAVSVTGDPLGEYYAYEYVMPNVRINDFPKFGVWNDAYFMATDEFLGSDFVGSGMFAFDREKMLSGDSDAEYIYFNAAVPVQPRRRGMLPADLDGLMPPPPDAPGIFMTYTADEYGDAGDALRLFSFSANFTNPHLSTFTEMPESPIAVNAFDPTSPDGRADIAQPPPGEFLDSQSDRLNSRIAYRNFGTHQSLVVNQTVNVSPPGSTYRAGVRVYELQNSGSAFAPLVHHSIGDNTVSRWIASAAQDHQGNLAVQYNMVSEEKRISIQYTGRLAGDPPNVFRQEYPLINSSGVQKAFGWRWGEYSGISADPIDDCTFWMTNAYYTADSEIWSDMGWLTRVGAFKFDECTAAPRGLLRVSLFNAADNSPIDGGSVNAGQFHRTTSASGQTSLILVTPGNYFVNASAKGFAAASTNVNVPDNINSPTDVTLSLTPIAEIVSTGININNESCPINPAPNPGETVTATITFTNNGLANAVNLRAVLLNGNGIISSETPQELGSLSPDQSASTTFTFTIDSAIKCGESVAPVIRLTANGENLADINLSLQTGIKNIAFSENFDNVVAPAIPQGWTTSSTENHQLWRTAAARSTSGSNALFSPSPLQRGVNEVISPSFFIQTPNAELSLKNWYEHETTFLRNRLYDGSLLEISFDGGAWQDIIDAGGRFVTGGYDGTIDSCCQNPLGGRQGWSGRSGIHQVSEFIDTVVKLPSAAAGKNVRLRFRVGNDVGTFREGQYIDDLVVTDGFDCSCNAVKRNAKFDFDGDGQTDIGVYKFTDTPDADIRYLNSSNAEQQSVAFGSAGDLPAFADFDGDGKTDIAIFRPATGDWWIMRSSDATVGVVHFGIASDKVVPADFDGDGRADIAVYRPETGVWYILQSTNGSLRVVQFGLADDIPLKADLDGDGKADVVIYRPSNGTWYADLSGGGVSIIPFGISEDKPVPGDFDGDDRDDIAVFRPSNGTWYLLQSQAGFAAARFGLTEDIPLQADFDGDGKDDIALYRPSSQTWYYIRSSDQVFAAFQFGTAGESPIPAAFVSY